MSDQEEHQEPSGDADPTPQPQEAAPPVVKKTWGQFPAAPSEVSSNGTGAIANSKKSLMEIMAEEEDAANKAKREKEEAKANQRVVDQEEKALQEALRASMVDSDTKVSGSDLILPDDDELDEETRRAIMLSMTDEKQTSSASAAAAPAAAAAAPAEQPVIGISAEELEAIERALREADDAETAQSFQFAMNLQDEEAARGKAAGGQQSMGSAQLEQGNVRTVTRADYMREQEAAILGDVGRAHAKDDDEDDELEQGEAGFRLNSSRQQPSQWNRLDQGSIIGPNKEVRTKHDLELQSQANAYRLSLDLDHDAGPVHLGNKAFNSFKRSVQKATSGNTKNPPSQGRPKMAPSAEKPMAFLKTAPIAVDAGALKRVDEVAVELMVVEPLLTAIDQSNLKLAPTAAAAES
jgi:hypothetical protein